MTTRNFNEDEVNKLKHLLGEGIQILTETETLRDGLKDTVAAIAEELNVKPAVLNKAIRVAYKAEFTKQEEAFSELEDILRATGRDY